MDKWGKGRNRQFTKGKISKQANKKIFTTQPKYTN